MKHSPRAPVHESPARTYIFTIPKAGTYLMDAFLTCLGSSPTGWHVSMNHYLDTLQFDAQTNKAEPSKTNVKRPYLASFKQVPAGGHAFGHFNPLFVPPAALNALNYRVIAVRRHPREVLVSEFIDFRHRRTDVRFVSEATIADPVAAFETYLREHGPVIRNICANYVLLQDTSKNIFYRQIMGHERSLFLDFRQFIDAKRGGETAQRIAQFLHLDLTPEQVLERWHEALDADNKTKSDDVQLGYGRESLWSDKANALYESLGFTDIAAYLGY